MPTTAPPFTYPTPPFPGPLAGWLDFPPAIDSQLAEWYFWIQFWYAMRERTRAAGFGRWFPFVSKVWTQPTVTDAVDNDDGTSTLTFAETFCTTAGDVPWVFPCDPTPPSDAPVSYDGAIDDDDATKAVGNLPIIGIGTHTVTVQARLADYVTAKQWAKVSDAVGRIFPVTRSGEPWWNDVVRLPPWPNAPTFITGTVLSATASKIRVDKTTYDDDEWNGYEIMVRDTAGRLHRLTITGTTTDTTDKDNPVGVLTFTADKPGTPTGDFTVIAAGGMFMPGRPDAFPCQFYAGEMQAGSVSHRADDVIDGGPGFPQTQSESYDHSEDDASPCDTPTRDPMLDTDAKTPEQATCTTPSHFLNPGVTRTIRYLEAFGEFLCTRFLPQNTKQGSSKTTAFLGMAPATWFDLFGCDSVTTTVSGTSATADPAAFEYADGLSVAWAIKDLNGGVVKAGSATLDADGLIASLPSGFDGCPIVVSPGMDRWFEKTIGALTDRAWFLPDVDPDAPGPGTTYVYPPTAAHPGRWNLITAPTHYQETNVFGSVGESAKDYYLFQDGDLARLIGLNWSDPTNIYGTDDSGNPILPAVHYDRAFVGRRGDETQGRIAASMSGKATTFSKRQLRDDSKNWWTVDWWGDGSIGDGGAMTVHSGTDFVGSSGMTLSTLAGSGYVTQTPPRFMVCGGATIRFRNGFDSDHKPIWIYRQLASQDASGNVTFTEPMTTTGSLYWELREPDGRPNRWRSCDVTLTVTLDNGTILPKQTVALDGNGDRALYLPATANIPANAASVSYSIDDPQTTDTCIVMERASGKWKRKTDGHDAVRPGVTDPVDFTDDPYLNLPDLLRDYGRFVPGDLALPYAIQLKAGIIALKHRPLTAAFTDKANDTASATLNSASATTGSAYWGDAVDAGDPHNCKECDTGDPYSPSGGTPDMEAWLDSHITTSAVDGTAPRARTDVAINPGTAEATATAIAAYAKVAGIPGFGMIPNPSITEWLWASLDGSSNCIEAGTCDDGSGGFRVPNTFTANHTAVVCLDWAQVGSFSILPTGNAYTGLIGSTSLVEWPATINCPAPSPCSPTNPSGTTPSGGGGGGWQTDANQAVATWGFVYG